MNKLHLRPTQKYASAAAILSYLDCKERAIQYLGLTDASFRGPVWRDSPDDNGAAIKMRAASRHDMMIALSPSLCKPVLRCLPAILLCHRDQAAPAMSAMPRKRPLAVKMAPVAKGHIRPLTWPIDHLIGDG